VSAFGESVPEARNGVDSLGIVSMNRRGGLLVAAMLVLVSACVPVVESGCSSLGRVLNVGFYAYFEPVRACPRSLVPVTTGGVAEWDPLGGVGHVRSLSHGLRPGPAQRSASRGSFPCDPPRQISDSTRYADGSRTKR